MAEAKSEGKDTSGNTSGASADTSKSSDTTASEPDQQAEAKSESTSGAKSEAKPESTSETKAEAKSDTKTETKSSAKPADKPASSRAKTKDDADSGDKKKGRSTKETVQSVRTGVASAVWLLSVLAALILAAGALVIALDFNRDNAVVHFFITTADNINFLGTMKKFEPTGKSPDAVHSALVKTVLVNWGICAVAYLVIGKILDRIIRP